MTNQDISTLLPSYRRVAPIGWAIGWRVTLMGLLLNLWQPSTPTTPELAVIGGIGYALTVLLPFIAFAFSINRSLTDVRLEIAHVKYGYLVQEHLLRGLASSVSWAFVWRFLLLSSVLSWLIAAAYALTHGGTSASVFAEMKASAFRGRVLFFYEPLHDICHGAIHSLGLVDAGESHFPTLITTVTLQFLQALAVAATAASLVIYRLIGRVTRRFTYVLVPADPNEAAEPHSVES